ncbi:MAG: hypothetical protein ABI288_06790 [Ginsengibacter sp.]
MDKREKLAEMEKLSRVLEDIVNTQTSLLKKIAQVEVENMNLGNGLIDKQIPDMMSKSDETLELATKLDNEFKEATQKFIKDNKLDEVLTETV